MCYRPRCDGVACCAASTAERALGLQLWVRASGGRSGCVGAEMWHEGYSQCYLQLSSYTETSRVLLAIRLRVNTSFNIR